MELNINSFLLELKKSIEDDISENIVDCILSTNLIRVNFGLKIAHSDSKTYIVLNTATLLKLENYLQDLTNKPKDYLYHSNIIGIPVIENDKLVKEIVPSKFLVKEI